MTAPLRLNFSALSDLGRFRKDNQDSGYAGPHLLVVADGVGGAAYGDVASHTAVMTLRRMDVPGSDAPLDALAGSLHRVHDRIAELVDQDPELAGTSTTVTAAHFDGQSLSLVHVGDSRAYLLRAGQIVQLTKDHTFVQSLIDEGKITEEQARTHPHRNLILKAIDGVHDAEPDLVTYELAAGDRIMLCSDGCSGAVDDDELARVLGEGTVDYACVELVRTALDNGTTDNVTVVVADVLAGDAVLEPETSAAAAVGPLLVGAAAGQPRKLGGDGVPARTGAVRGAMGAVADRFRGVEEEEFDPEAARYALRPPRRYVWVRRAVLSLLLIAVFSAAAKAAYDYSQDQFYVGANESGEVAVFRGIDVTVPGVTMSTELTTTSDPIAIDDLAEATAEQVRAGIPADSEAAAVERLEAIREELLEQCQPTSVVPTPSASATQPPSPQASPEAEPDSAEGCVNKTPVTPSPRATNTPSTSTAATAGSRTP